jgi:hypothetical protein
MATEELKVAPKEVDINDLQLADEQVDVNAEADAFAGPPPPSDGDHRVKLSLGNKKVQQGKDKNGKLYYMVHLQMKVQPGDPFENRVVFNNVFSTVNQNGTSTMIGVMKALGESVSARESILDLTRRLVNRVAGEPEVIVTTQWRAYCADCDKTVLRGEKRFPQNPDGSHRHQFECKTCGSLVSAQAEPVAYKLAS